MLSGIIRAMGDSKTPLAFLTLSSFLNIALDSEYILLNILNKFFHVNNVISPVPALITLFSGLRRFMANSMWLSILFSAVMTVATAVFCRQMLTAMKTPEDIYPYAYQLP